PVPFAPAPMAAPPVPFAPVPVAAPPPIAFAPAQFAPAPGPVAPPAPPIGIAAVQPGALKVRSEPPAGFTPPRSEAGSSIRALPMITRPAGEERSSFPWQLAVAAILILAVGIIAGRGYLQKDSAPPAELAKAGAGTSDSAPSAQAGPTGTLVIDSQPTGAKVTLNGEDVGLTPLKLESVKAGKHTVAITTPTATVRRTVRVEAGKLVTLDIPVYSGWVVIFSPIPLDISEEGRALGNTETGKILLPPGRHLLTLSNRDFGFTDTRTVEIYPGEERPLNIEPKGRVNVNAHPWAEVWVDGNKAGDTPIANLQVLLGTRVFIFKHPQYGERRITATITTTIAALSVDFTKPANAP
ncbi:MAG TPA: PEGA domain-containing protein, partial [Vicinamibacterales bacterium]|nr:PEGA domain-containing protein [Vicinamibacterales bacterium]